MNEFVVCGHRRFPFEWWAFEVGHCIVFAARDGAEGTRRFKVNGVDGLGHSHDFTHRITGISREHMAESRKIVGDGIRMLRT